ncbi:MAG: hypothetical protein ACOYWZ_00095 [Bacillota bacterium]
MIANILTYIKENIRKLMISFGYIAITEHNEIIEKIVKISQTRHEDDVKKVTERYINEIDELKKKDNNEIRKLNEVIEIMEREKEEKLNLIHKLTKEIEELKILTRQVKIKLEIEPPAFLDTTQNAYLPYVQWKGGNVGLRPECVYETNPFLEDWFFSNINRDAFEKKTKYEKIVSIWYAILDVRKYTLDSGDNWQFPQVTICRKECDCEDGTTLFVSLCMAIGLSPNEVFNAVGQCSFGYHSYPIVFFKKEELPADMVEGWYIFETTLPQGTNPQKPKTLKTTSSYYLPDSLANWNFSGVIKKEYEQCFK